MKVDVTGRTATSALLEENSECSYSPQGPIDTRKLMLKHMIHLMAVYCLSPEVQDPSASLACNRKIPFPNPI